MGLIQHIADYFKKDALTASKLVDLLNRGTPLISFGKDIYNIPEVRTAINFISEKVGSIPFYHIRADTEGNITVINDSFAYVLGIRTNPYHGPQVFWTHVITRYLLMNNCFILPEWDESGRISALYPLPFGNSFEFEQDEAGKLIITFMSDQKYQFYYDDIIHLQRFPTTKGGIKRQATENYVEIVSTLQNQAVNDSAVSGRLSAILQVKSSLKGSDMKKKLDDFKDLFLTAENSTGFGMIGAEYDIHPLDMKFNPLDSKLMGDITRNLYNYFGVSFEIINGTANELQYEQFIDNTIKPIAYQIEEELTYKLFSRNEVAHFNRVQAELIDLEISTLAAKTSFYKEMVYGTILSRNEIRKRLRIPKGPKELDKFLENKNFQVLQTGDMAKGGGIQVEQNGTGETGIEQANDSL